MTSLRKEPSMDVSWMSTEDVGSFFSLLVSSDLLILSSSWNHFL